MKRVAKAITFRTITSSTSPITIVGPNIVDTFRAQLLGTIPKQHPQHFAHFARAGVPGFRWRQVLKIQLLKAHSVFRT
jgi:hypothetical protein